MMKLTNDVGFRVLAVCLLFVAGAPLRAQVSFGDAQQLNDGWLFMLAEDGEQGTVLDQTAMRPEGDDAQWTRVQLPHDWGAQQPMSPQCGSCQGYLPGGLGWYRRHFVPSADDVRPGRRLFVYFEGVYCRSTVYLNGHELGYRPNGFASFLYDLTPYLRAGEDNVLAVRVDHRLQNDARWYTGSGINRNVWLVRAPDVHLALWGCTWRTRRTGRKGGKERWTVEVDIATTNEGAEQPTATYSAEVVIVDAEGTVVATARTPVTIGEKHTQRIEMVNPHLWTLAAPYIYNVRARLLADGKEVDHAEIPMGVRTLEFSADKGFALNGQWMKVKGVCLHDDAGVLGTAVPKTVWRQRLATLKRLGVNAIRMSHNPHAPMVYDLCDSLGLLVMDEASDEWEFPKRKWLKGWNRGKPGYEGAFDYFDEWIDRDVADMVRRDRCHPSIFLWSIGNEVDYPNDPYSHPVLNGDKSMTQPIYGGYKPDQPNADRVGRIAQRLATVVRGIDGSRAVTGALAGVVMSNETAYPDAVDVVGYNYTESRYKEDHATYPRRVIYGSENRHDLAAWKAVKDNEHIFGQFLWTGIDYLGESGPWPARGSEAGLLDLAGQVKPLGWYRAALWSDAPVCYIGTYPSGRANARNNRGGNREGVSPYAPSVWNYDEGQRVRVVCYTNAESARLSLNGKAVGGVPTRDPETGILYWDIDYEPGVLRCEAFELATPENIIADSEVVTNGRPYALRATVLDHGTQGEGVVTISVEVVDEDGRRVVLADNEVTCQLPFTRRNADHPTLRLLGMENGDIRDTRDKTQPRCRVKNGRLVVYIAANAASEIPARITFTSPLLCSDSVEW